MEERKNRVDKLKEFMKECGKTPVCLAFSGGVDSSLLLKLACDNGTKYKMPVYAVTFDSMLHPSCDLEIAKQVAKEMGAIHVVIKVDELEQREIKKNPVDRCYLCKRHLFQNLKKFAEEKGVFHLLDGTNEDDLHVYRPGIRALKELGIESPLALCHITKSEVKALAKEYGISVASRPAAPCMATRLPYGAKLDYTLLKRIETGEQYLKTMLSGNIRLRVHEDVVRIEIDEAQMSVFMEKRRDIICELKKLGFLYVTLDLEGFRSGSMDIYLS